MNINQITSFIKLAQTEHLTKTAALLNYTVPTLSNMITGLEEELGVKLFDRVGRNIKLNKNGELFYKYAKDSMGTLNIGIEKLKDQNRSIDKTIYTSATDIRFWQKPFAEFIDSNPELLISRTAIDTYALSNPSRLNGYDFIFCAEDDINDVRWDHLNLFKTQAVILLSKGHKWEKRRKPITIDELAKEKILFISGGYSGRRYADALCSAEGMDVNHDIECDVMMRSMMLHKSSEYVSITTSYAYKCMEDVHDLKVIPLETKYPKRNMAMFWRKEAQLSESQKKFFSFFKDYYKNIDEL